jgi:hypothetical protein
VTSINTRLGVVLVWRYIEEKAEVDAGGVVLRVSINAVVGIGVDSRDEIVDTRIVIAGVGFRVLGVDACVCAVIVGVDVSDCSGVVVRVIGVDARVGVGVGVDVEECNGNGVVVRVIGVDVRVGAGGVGVGVDLSDGNRVGVRALVVIIGVGVRGGKVGTRGGKTKGAIGA